MERAAAVPFESEPREIVDTIFIGDVLSAIHSCSLPTDITSVGRTRCMLCDPSLAPKVCPATKQLLGFRAEFLYLESITTRSERSKRLRYLPIKCRSPQRRLPHASRWFVDPASFF
jgi:hypothetical protein